MNTNMKELFEKRNLNVTKIIKKLDALVAMDVTKDYKGEVPEWRQRMDTWNLALPLINTRMRALFSSGQKEDFIVLKSLYSPLQTTSFKLRSLKKIGEGIGEKMPEVLVFDPGFTYENVVARLADLADG